MPDGNQNIRSKKRHLCCTSLSRTAFTAKQFNITKSYAWYIMSSGLGYCTLMPKVNAGKVGFQKFAGCPVLFTGDCASVFEMHTQLNLPSPAPSSQVRTLIFGNCRSGRNLHFIGRRERQMKKLYCTKWFSSRTFFVDK